MKNLSMFATLLAAAVLAACSNNGEPWHNPPGYGTDCIPPSNAQLVYPSNNATGVPDNTMAVYIAVPSPLSSPSTKFDTEVAGTPTYGSQLTNGFTPVSYASIPTPNTVPTYANPQYYETTLRNTLAATMTFDVYWNELNSACATGTSASFLGSFTTQ